MNSDYLHPACQQQNHLMNFFFHISCLENPMDRGTWQATVHGVTKS